MFAIQYPSCGAKTSFSLTDSTYEGPFRCWKCRGAFKARIENGELKACKPISEEELEGYNK